MNEEIKQYLEYNPETGLIFWKQPRRCVKAGDRAGSVNQEGYIEIRVNYKSYKAHRIAWFLYYGVPPVKSLDHINGIRTDNRIVNLREVTERENCSNKIHHIKGKLLGTSFRKPVGKYVAQINIKGKNIYVGAYDTELEAHHAYLNARKKYCGY